MFCLLLNHAHTIIQVTQFAGERLYTEYDHSHNHTREGNEQDEEDEENGGSFYDTTGGDGAGGMGNPELSADIIDRHIANNEAMRKDLVMLHGALEFMRTGNVEALSNRLKKEWRRYTILLFLSTTLFVDCVNLFFCDCVFIHTFFLFFLSFSPLLDWRLTMQVGMQVDIGTIWVVLRVW